MELKYQIDGKGRVRGIFLSHGSLIAHTTKSYDSEAHIDAMLVKIVDSFNPPEIYPVQNEKRHRTEWGFRWRASDEPGFVGVTESYVKKSHADRQMMQTVICIIEYVYRLRAAKAVSDREPESGGQ